MPQIKVLPVNLRNKIAAGEVVERPASAVKELIENAIDAGSTDIKIDVLAGGKRLIRVSDNGSGMDREDALLCFERHATSKLSDEKDLFDLRTLGFRGEALPSIASISKVKLVTGIRGSASGISVEVHGGETKEVRESAFLGTSIEIRDIFYNTPARKKFLKTNTTELFHIIDTVTKEALSHWNIGFTLSTENEDTMSLPKASGFRERIMQVYGEEFLRGLIEVKAEEGDMRLTAFISKSSNFRGSRSHQFIFVNTRPIKDQSVSHAIYKAYEGILPADKHPAFLLFMDLNPAEVDFNVHPTKREVRFADKEAVYRFVLVCLRDAVKGERAEYAKEFSVPVAEAPIPPYDYNLQPKESVASRPDFVAENGELQYRASLPFIYLGDTFIAVSGKGGLTLIDHHAAHERILYEKFLGRTDIPSHNLLFPEQVKLSKKEYLAVLGQKDLLSEYGIEVDDFGHDTIIVRSLPDALASSDLRGIIADVAAALIEGVAPNRSLKEAIAARIACHSSVRGSMILNQEEFSRLLSDLEKTEHPDQCPHGRPTRIFYSLEDLKKIFKRK
ncbi:MAG: DNA mismatch repair endonuclease MutL [Nitrospirae bacterium]|nr:DNA mismatch repair endonuclease MutL [Nitrospirota bacterium]